MSDIQQMRKDAMEEKLNAMTTGQRKQFMLDIEDSYNKTNIYGMINSKSK